MKRVIEFALRRIDFYLRMIVLTFLAAQGLWASTLNSPEIIWMKGGHTGWGGGGMYLGVTTNESRAITVSNEGPIKVWDLPRNRLLRTAGTFLDPNWGQVRKASFGHHGERVAVLPTADPAFTGFSVAVWNCDSGELERTFGPFGEPASIALSPDERTLAVGFHEDSAGEGKIRIYGLPDGAALREFVLPNWGALDLCYSPDGASIARIGDLMSPSLEVMTISDGSVITIDSSLPSPSAFGFSPHGRYIAEGHDEGIYVWDLTTGKRILTFTSAPVKAIAFSPDETLLAFSGENGWTGPRSRIQIIRLPDGAALTFCEGHSIQTLGLAFSADSSLLYSTGLDGDFLVWDPLTGARTRQIETDVAPITALAFSPDGKTVAAGFGEHSMNWLQQIKCRSAADGQFLKDYGDAALQNNTVVALSFSVDGTNLAAAYKGCGGTAQVIELAGGKKVFSVDGAAAKDYVNFSRGGEWLFVADNYSWEEHMRVFNARDFKQIVSIPSTWWKGVPSEMCGMECLDSSPNGDLLLIGHSDNILRLWDWRASNVLWKANAHLDKINHVAFSSEGDLVASASEDKTLKVWDATSGRLMQLLTGHGGAVLDVAFSPDGKVLASAGANTVRFWDPRAGISLATFDKETMSVSALAFSPSGEFVAIGRKDATLVLARNPFYSRASNQPRLSVVRGSDSGSLSLTVSSLAASTCRFESSSNLINWVEMDARVPVDGVVRLEVNATGVARFFRLRLDY